MTGYLQTVNRTMRPYAAAGPVLTDLLERTGQRRILDLCSGAGGPWPELLADLRHTHPDLEVCCSDLYPHLATAKAFEAVDGLSYRVEPTSARDVPVELPGVRTLFTALHHFDPPAVVSILESARAANAPLAAFEVTNRSGVGVATTFVMPILALALMPRVRPRRLMPLLFSYLPPIVPLAIGWDGTVSTLRSYRVEELRAMAEPLQSPEYRFTVEERATGTPLPMTCLIGEPVAAASGGTVG